jgi:hypothetical protein
VNLETLDITLGEEIAIAVPSQQSVTLLDIIWNSEGPDGPAPRFRFLAPAIARAGGSVDFAAVEGDLQHLCQTYVLQALAEKGVSASLVLMSIADRPVEFGSTDPEATQYFDVFSIMGTTCTREIF